MGTKSVYFHLLNAEGTKIEKTIHADKKADEKRFELESWYKMDDKACLVDRIAFSGSSVDVFLKPIDKKLLQ